MAGTKSDCSALSRLCSKDCLHDQGNSIKCRNRYDLTHGIKNSNATGALAGKIRGAINAWLDLLLHFCVKTKVEIKKYLYINEPE